MRTEIVYGTLMVSFRYGVSSDDRSLEAAPNVSFPHGETSTLELVSPDSWITMDG